MFGFGDGDSDHHIVMLFRRLLEKGISPGVDEEADVGFIGGLASAPDAIGIIDSLAELSIRRKLSSRLQPTAPALIA